MSFHRRCESIGICGLRVARQKTSCQGFTLIELLIVVVILGVLGMIALPSFLNQAARAQQTKALNAVGAMNRAQQSFFYENGQFSNSITELGFAHLNEGRAYRYAVQGDNQATTIVAQPEDSALRGYTGLAYLNRDGQGNVILSSKLCEGNHGYAPTPSLVLQGDQLAASDCNAL